jgi:ATP-binding cassette subfamily B protein
MRGCFFDGGQNLSNVNKNANKNVNKSAKKSIKTPKQAHESRFRIFANNAYAVKTVWGLSKSRVFSCALINLIGYAEWVLSSIVFLRLVIGQIENEAPFRDIMIALGAFYVMLLIFSLISEWYQNSTVHVTNDLIRKKLYNRLYKKARNVELRCFENAEFYNRYTAALDGSAEKMTQAVDNFFGIVCGVIAAAAAFSSMFMIDKFSVLFVIPPIIGNFVFGSLMNKVYTGRYNEGIRPERIVGYVNRVMYLAEYAKEIRLSNIHKLLRRYYDDSVQKLRDIGDKYGKRGIIIFWVGNCLTFAMVFEGIMIYAAYRTMITGSMGLAELAIMFSAMSTSTWIIIGLFGHISDALKNGKFLEYFRTFITYKEVIPEDQDGIIPDSKIRSVEFENVSFSYDAPDDEKHKNVINNLSFTVSNDQICAFVGHNGAGKTTLIKLLLRLYDPDTGVIKVNGVDIKEYNLRAYRRLFAAAFQDGKLMSMSVRGNILAGEKFDETEAEKLVLRALESAGIKPKIDTLKSGVDTILTKEFDEDGAVLSGGETQKLVVARAFARGENASVKVFDEPSSALDPIAEYELYKSIMRESKNNITFFISHRLSSVKDADVVFMLENGSVIESGSHADLIVKRGKYAEMFSMQAKNYLADDDEIQSGVFAAAVTRGAAV